MKTSIVLSAVVVALCAPGVFAAEKVVELDASGGKSQGHWVAFVSKAMAPDNPMGTAAIAIGKGDAFDGAFGMTVIAGKPTASAVSQEAIKAERESEKEPPATTTIVAVTDAQYKEVKALVEEYCAQTEFVDAPNNVTANFAVAVVDALGMKRAYRSGLQPVVPVQYFEDLAVINRKLGKETT